jgi:hypothetical protein
MSTPEPAAGQPAGLAIWVPIAPGELLDKVTILEIKQERITDESKRAHVRHELELLRGVCRKSVPASPRLEELTRELKHVNETLWDIEDEIRRCERQQAFTARFIELARSVYLTNDRRSEIKREINGLLGSSIIEEKWYP